MAVRLARSLAASSSSRRSFISLGNHSTASDITSSAINGGDFSNFGRAFAFYSSSSSWWSSPDDLTAGSKRREKQTTDRFSAVIDAVHDWKLPPELRGRRDFVRYSQSLSMFMCSSSLCVFGLWNRCIIYLGFIGFVENLIQIPNAEFKSLDTSLTLC